MLITASLAQIISQVVISHPASAAGSPGLTYALGILLALAALLLFWTLPKSRQLEAQLADATEAQTKAKESLNSTKENARKNEKQLEEKRTELLKAKGDIATQRKKNHSAQGELKDLKQELLKNAEELLKLRSINPTAAAFTKKPTQKEAPLLKKQVVVAETSVHSPEAIKAQEAEISALTIKLEGLMIAHKAQTIKLGKIESQRLDEKKQLSEQRRRLNNYQRVDMVSKSQLELANDKLSQMGREYYDVVSELAQLKGEVPKIDRVDHPLNTDLSAAPTVTSATASASKSHADKEEPSASAVSLMTENNENNTSAPTAAAG